MSPLSAQVTKCFSLAVLCAGFAATSFAQQPKVLAPHKPVAPRLARHHNWEQPSSLQSAVGGLWMIGPSMKASLYLTNGLKADPLREHSM
jgi:hypothetical protein